MKLQSLRALLKILRVIGISAKNLKNILGYRRIKKKTPDKLIADIYRLGKI